VSCADQELDALAMSEHLPIVLIELVLVFGGVLLFAVWQLRSVKRDQEKSRAERAARDAAAAMAAAQTSEAGGAAAKAADAIPTDAKGSVAPPPAADR
jgi:type II secretory pathway pseudopilin PulG